ncbi:MAG: cation transporter [Bacteroidetes bacterium]|nr:cation transporter [Bacteroidota bacterium]MBS1757561.1 cation transporter [Bacteroidota bacterium]
MKAAAQNLRIQKNIAIISIALFIIKIIAWYITNSVAILTDALESIVNVVAGLIGVYSLYISAKPKDIDHPYGHGKVEFISAAIEGTLIMVAGLFIIYKAVINLKFPQQVNKIDYGILLVVFTAIINYLAGIICVNIGKKNNSLALIASGKHLKADTYTTLGIVAGLLLLLLTNIAWIDSAVALIFALIILITGYKIIRSSIAGIMDEADEILLNDLVATLNENRTSNWIDLHNLRIIKYGPTLHLDCHLTVPWYFNVNEAHREIDALSKMVKNKFGETMELFVHSDACMEFSCAICEKSDCAVRRHPFTKRVKWTIQNISSNHKHDINS